MYTVYWQIEFNQWHFVYIPNYVNASSVFLFSIKTEVNST